MAQKHTAVEVHDQTGTQVRAVSQENDFPLPPVEELAKLNQFRPDLVDKAIELTVTEANKRRERMATVDHYVFVQNLVSSAGAIAVSLVAFCGAVYLALNDHDWAAIALVGATLGTVVYAISHSNK